MKLELKSTIQMFGIGCLLIGSMAVAQIQDSSVQQPAPDNTTMNKGDAQTADQQKDNRSDRDTTQQIRRSIIKDKSLSSYAHNVKIISQDGMVTLKGPVRSEEEKQTIEQKAADIVGKDKVTSELTVKPKQ